MTITESFVEEFLTTLDFDLFEFDEAWCTLEDQFCAWSKTEATVFYNEHPHNARMIERFLNDETGGGAIACIVNA